MCESECSEERLSISKAAYVGSGRSVRLGELDFSIEHHEREIEATEKQLTRMRNNLKELKKVRKLVTPEIEAAVSALKKVNLI